MGKITIFKTNITNIYGVAGEAWLAELPQRVKALQDAWGLSDLQVLPDLSYNYVLSGTCNSRPIILKMGVDTQSLQREAKALKTFADFGAVKVLKEEAGALLLERVTPGTPLNYDLSNSLQTACQVARTLHQAPVPSEGFPHIRDWLKALDQAASLIPETLPYETCTRLRAYFEKAICLRNTLGEERSDKDVLLHGDLHPGNILQGPETWKVIDPKGVIGNPIHETWAFVKNIETDTAFIATFFSFDLKKVRGWYFIHIMLALCWTLEDHGNQKLFLDLADQAHLLTGEYP